MKPQILKGDDVDFILDIYKKSKKKDKLILFYNDELLFIKNDYNKIKKILKNIVSNSIEEYNDHLYKIDFYNNENYNSGNKIFQLNFIEICLSNENNKKNNIYMLKDESFSVINYIFCLDNLFIIILNKRYECKIGDLIIFPCGWSFYYKVEPDKLYIIGELLYR